MPNNILHWNRLRIWNFQGYWRKSKWIFRELIKNNVEFPVLWSFLEWSLVLSGISRGKVKILKNPGGVSKRYVLNPPCLVFSGIAHCDTGSLQRSIFVWEVKPLLFYHIPHIFAVNIISKTSKIPSLIAFYKLFLIDIKIKILINSWHFLMVYVDVPSANRRLIPSIFSKWKVLRWYTCRASFSDKSDLICSSRVLDFQMFSWQQKLSI